MQSDSSTSAGGKPVDDLIVLHCPGAHTEDTIREHAQVEHPGVAWNEQAAVFTTGRFAEGRAR